MATPELGSKQVCPNCQAKFYDLNRRPAHCPKCDTEFDPLEAIKTRRVRGRTGPADLDDTPEEEAEDQVKVEAEADDEEEEEVTPEIDEVVEDVPIVPGDDEEDAEPVPEGDGMAEVTEDDDVVLDDEEDDSLPFLEDEDDDFEEEIEGLPAGEEEP